MFEIVYSETKHNRDKDTHYTPTPVPTDSKTSIIKSRGKVSMVHSVLMVGAPRQNPDKRFYEWRSQDSIGLRTTSAGNVVPYACARPYNVKTWRHTTPGVVFDTLEGDSELYSAFAHAVWETFGIRTANDIYPMMDTYGLIRYNTIPNTLRMGFRTTSIVEMATAAFGKSRINPRLLSAVANTEPYIVAFAQQFRGLVDDDKIIKFMEANHFDDEMESCYNSHSPKIRKGLLVANQSVRDRLINNRLDSSSLRSLSALIRYGEKYIENRFKAAPPHASLTQIAGW